MDDQQEPNSDDFAAVDESNLGTPPVEPNGTTTPPPPSDTGGGGNVDVRDTVMVRSQIQTTHVDTIQIEGETKILCPTCGNIISDTNHLLVCEDCGTHDFCESCERILTKRDQYRGFRLEFDWPLCRTCYKSDLRQQVMMIESGQTDGFEPYEEQSPPKPPRLHAAEGALSSAEFTPIVETSKDKQIAVGCAYVGIVVGIISVFVLGFILGSSALLLGYVAKVRGESKGNFGLLLGLLGIGSSVFWMIFTGEASWYLAQLLF